MEIIGRQIRSLVDLEQYEADWRRLEKGKDMTVFQSYDWHYLLTRQFLKSSVRLLSELWIFSLTESDGETVFLFPAVAQRRSTCFRGYGHEAGVYILGYNSWSDYNCAVYDSVSPAGFQAVISELHSRFPTLPLRLTDLRPDTLFARYLSSVCAEENISHAPAAAVHRRASAEEYSASLSKNTRQNLRTSRNRLEKDGLSFSIKVLSRIQDRDLAEQLRRIHTERSISKNYHDSDWKRRLISRIKAAATGIQERHNNIVADSMLRMENSVLVIAYINDEPAGYLYGLRDRSAVRIMHNCVSRKYYHYSPMFLGAYEYILRSYEDPGLTEVDFTRGDETYKLRLGAEILSLSSFVI